MSVNDQWNMSRLPIRVLPYQKKDLASCNEIIIDYLGDNPSYHIYITDKNDPKILIDITQLIIEEMFPNASINANNFYVTIEGLKDSQTLRDIINYIYKRFLMPDNPNGFDPVNDLDKIKDPTTKNILLTDTDGIIYLPITVAGNVIDSSGKSIQERLDDMTRLGFSTSFVRATTNNQSSFEFNYPFKDYPKYGNYVEVRIGSTYIDKARYEIINEKSADGSITSATLTFIDETVEKGRAINFLFIFNAKAVTGGKFENISGGAIADGTITSSKLEKVSDSFLLNDSTSIASSKALYNLFTRYINDINDRDEHVYYYYDDSDGDILYYGREMDTISSGDVLNIIAKNKKTLSKGIRIYHKPEGNVYYAVDSETGETVNDLSIELDPGGSIDSIQIQDPTEQTDGEYPSVLKDIIDIKKLYNKDGATPKTNLPAGRMIKLLYQNDCFYILNNNDIITNRYIYTCIDQETAISFKQLSYEYEDIINVYRNGVRLFEDLDYSMNSDSETITLFVRTEEGERIVFESIRV